MNLPTASFSNKGIFKQGSTTYYTASLFFPRPIKEDVFKLYAYVRIADDFVDQIPADHLSFELLVRQTWTFWDMSPKKNQQASASNVENVISTEAYQVIADFVAMAKQRGIHKEWVKAFLKAMELDLHKKNYPTITETNTYMYGSAEVIGLMLLKIFDSPVQAEISARLLGRAMQLINMIRDVAQDEGLGRCYLPSIEAEWCHLATISRVEALQNPHAFSHFLRLQLGRYAELMWRARQGFIYLPKELRIPVETASDMYDWTARAIWDDPMIVWQKKLKPSKLRVAGRGAQLWLSSLLGVY